MNGWNVWLLYKVQLNPAAPPRAAACQTGRQSARKTTERRARTSEQPPSSGNAAVAGFDVETERLQLREGSAMGYCPQACNSNS